MSMALVLSMAAARRAEAADEQSIARLEVRALPSCTTREELVARVTARSRRISFVDTVDDIPTVRATIEAGAAPGSVIGEMEMVRSDGRRASRRITARSCAEATDALALVIALTLDPTGVAATESSTGASTARGAPTSVSPAAAAPAAAAPATATAAPTERPRAAEDALAAPPAPAVIRATEPPVPIVTRLRFGAGAAAQMVSGPAPAAMWGVAIDAGAYWDRNALWSPALVLSAMHTWSGNLQELGSVAAFTLDAVELDACPTRLTVSIAEARVCATASAGRLMAEGSDTFSPASASRLVATAGGAASIELDFDRFEVSGGFGAAASLIRHSFQFAPMVFHRVAPVTLTASLGLGVRFP
jgi:hypothetical protein